MLIRYIHLTLLFISALTLSKGDQYDDNDNDQDTDNISDNGMNEDESSETFILTEPPFSYRTGKLNQFMGFATPRPLPSNAQFMYASVWAAWSAWSYCVNNVRVRVRACNTVRGFSCLGKNQEYKECEPNNLSQAALQDSDYEAVDPWEADRKEAMRQLYPDYFVADGTNSRVTSDSAIVPIRKPNYRKPKTTAKNSLRGVEEHRARGSKTENNGTKSLKIPSHNHASHKNSVQSAQENDGGSDSLSDELNPLNGDDNNVKVQDESGRSKHEKKQKTHMKEENSDDEQMTRGEDDNHDADQSKSDEHQEHHTTHQEARQQPKSHVSSSNSRSSAILQSAKQHEHRMRVHSDEETNDDNLAQLSYELPDDMSLDGALEAGSELMRSVEEDEKMPDNEKDHHHSHNHTTTHKPLTTPSSNSYKNRPHHHDERVKSQSAESAPESEPESEPTTKFVDQIQSSLKSLQSPSRKVAVIDDHASAERKPKRVEPSLSKLTNERRIAVDQQISTESDLDENSEATGDRHETTHGKTETASKTWPNSAIDYSDEDQLIEKLLQEEDTEKALAMLLDRMTAEAADKLHSDNNDKQQQRNSQKKPHSGELFHIRVKNRHSATSAEDEKYRKMTNENDHHAFSNKLSIQPSISFGSLAELDDGAATNEHQRGTSSNGGEQSPLNEIESLRATVKKMQDELNSLNRHTSAQQRAFDLNLVPLPDSSHIELSHMDDSPIQVIDRSDVNFLNSQHSSGEAYWSEWSDWGKCQCNKELRTRRCEYDNTNPMSKGCSGKSYEVRECFDGLPCHTTRPPPIPPSHLLRLNKRKGHSDQKSSSSSDNNKLSLKAKRPTSSLTTGKKAANSE